MSPISPAAHAAAGRLLAAVDVDADAHARDPIATAERASADLGNALARWFGPYGTHALLTRALARTRPDHPVLADVRVRGPLAPVLDGLADAVPAHGPAAVTAGVVAVLGATVDLLGRMIGEDMALHLVERSMEGSIPPDPNPSPAPGVPRAAKEAGPDVAPGAEEVS